MPDPEGKLKYIKTITRVGEILGDIEDVLFATFNVALSP